MLQQNNNNNYPCLDHGVLQADQKSSVPFATGPLDFGDMSLIKTLRAWAKSGLSAKARGGAASLHHHHHHHHHHLAKPCQQSSGPAHGSGVPLSARCATGGPTRGVAGVQGGQAGLGALVTVATLKASEGGRQTQTRCLLLKAEGRNYVCAVSGTNRAGTAGPTAPSRATLVGSWLRDAVVGSKEAPGAKNAVARNGSCDGEVFRVKPRPAKKWRKLSNSATTTTTDTSPNKQDHTGSSPHKSEEDLQQQQQHQQKNQDHHGAKNNCVGARLNVHGRKQARGSAHRGNSRTKERRGTAKAASKQGGLHNDVVLAKENVDIINVPCAEEDTHSRTVKADLKNTWTDCSATGPESKGEDNRVVTEPSCQISHFTEPRPQEEQSISLHINNSLAETQEEASTSPERTGDSESGVQEEDDPREQTKDNPAKESLPSTWVSNLSPERHCCTELGPQKQHCCCQDLDTVFTSRENLPEPEPEPEPGPRDKAQLEAISRLPLSDVSPSPGGVCGEGEELDSGVEKGPKSDLPASPPWERDEAPQGSRIAQAPSGRNPDEAHAAEEDHGKEGQSSARALRTCALSEAGTGGGGGGGGRDEDGVSEQQDVGIRSADNNPPWTAPTESNTATTGSAPTVKSHSTNSSYTTTTTANANATTAANAPTATTGSAPTVKAPSTSSTTTTIATANANANAPAANTVAPATATVAHARPNPASPGAMATGLPGPRRGQSGAKGGAETETEAEGKAEGEPETETELPSQGQQGPVTETHTVDTVATDCHSHQGGGGGGGGGEGGERGGHRSEEEEEEEEEEEDEFGGFMQAGEAPVWEEGFTEFHQVPCRNVPPVSDKSSVSSWPSDWPASNPSHQSDDSWAAFSHDPDGQRRGEEIASGQWWPQSAVQDEADDLNAPRVFLEAFPPVPSLTFDLSGIPTLKQLLRGTAEQSRSPEDHGERSLLEGFQDLNKMFGLKHKRTESPSWKRLLASLQVDAGNSTHPKDLPQGHDLPSGHTAVSLQTQLVNKRRLSYDLNRNLLA